MEESGMDGWTNERTAKAIGVGVDWYGMEDVRRTHIYNELGRMECPRPEERAGGNRDKIVQEGRG